MKREITFRYENKEYTVTAEREGNAVIIERDGVRHSVEVVAEAVVGAPVAPRAAAPRSAAAPAAGGGAAGAAARQAPVATASGPGAVASPMTGVVKQIVAPAGTQVQEGARVVVIEAMKMEIDVCAPQSGTVTSVAAGAGDSVKEGQLLLTIG